MGWDRFCDDPLTAFRVWEGGMASHGGILGVLLFGLYYAWRHKINWVALTDGLAIVAPVGLFFGRIANFINGELYGRITPEHSWMGMKFPMEFHNEPHLTLQALQKIYTQCSPELLTELNQKAPAPTQIDGYAANWLVERVRDTPAIRDIVGSVLPERYPSQLYEGLAEGLILFAILWILRIVFPKAYTGVFCGLFAILYAIGRIIVENYREPDAPVWFDLTRGQFLSLFLFIIGGGFLTYAFKTKKTVQSTLHPSDSPL
jgi:phosphatidylglycerol:prolipoprotein diacylglycerol transferase